MTINILKWMLLGALLMFIVIKLISKDEEYILVTVVVIGIISLIFFYWMKLFLELDSNDRLPILTSFFSPILGFSGTYLIFHLTSKKEKKKAIAEFEKEKLKLQSESKKEEQKRQQELMKQEEEKKDKLEHKKNMLYSMLEYSVIHTRILTKEIEQWYKNNYKNINFSKEYNLTGNLKDDFETMILVKSKTDCGLFMDFSFQMDNIFRKKVNQYKIANNVIYINNWYDYLDCVPTVKDVQSITLWINLIKNSDMRTEGYTYKFLVNRDNINKIIQDNYPKAINDGLRGYYGMID